MLESICIWDGGVIWGEEGLGYKKPKTWAFRLAHNKIQFLSNFAILFSISFDISIQSGIQQRRAVGVNQNSLSREREKRNSTTP
jgi:hypothetical protein